MAEQAAAEDDDGDFMELDDAFYLTTCSLPGPRYSPFAPVAASTISTCIRGVAERMEGEPVDSGMASPDPHRLFLAEGLFSEDTQVYNLNDMFESLQSTSPLVASLVQNKSPDLEGWSVPGDEFNALRQKPSIMKHPSEFGRAKKRKASKAFDVMEGRVFRRKYLATERSEGADPGVSVSRTVPNFNDVQINMVNTSRGHEADEGEIQPQGFGSDVEYEEPRDNEAVGDQHAVGGNFEDLYKPGDEVLMRTMGWFPMEEGLNEGDNPSLSVRWIVDEPPSASDVPHLESVLEISPSKFWSPLSESKRRSAVRIGYLRRSSSESSHSIRYFLNSSPFSSPEVTRTMLHHTLSDTISTRKPSHRCSPACADCCGMTENIFTPAGMDNEPIMGSIRLPSLDSSRKAAAHFYEGVSGTSPALSEKKLRNHTSSVQGMASPVHQDNSRHQERCHSSTSEDVARRLQRGKNLVADFLEVDTSLVKIEAGAKTDDRHMETTSQPSSTLQDQAENTSPLSTRMRENCSEEIILEKLLCNEGGENPVLSFKFQNFQGSDGNCLVERDSSLPWPFSRDPDSATGSRTALHDRVASWPLCAEPVSDHLSNEHVSGVHCLEVFPDVIAWSATGSLRVSRKRSSRIRKPKFRGVEVLNKFESGEVAQPVRSSPSICGTCRKRKSLTPKRSTFEELPTFPRNVELRHVESAPTNEYETDLRSIPMREGTSPAKTPTLTRVVKPLRLVKTLTSKGITYVSIKPIVRSSVVKRLPTESREVKSLQFVQITPVKDSADASKAVLTSSRNSGQRQRRSGEASKKREPDEEIEYSAGCEVSKIPALRSSKYRGVTRHRHTGRFEAHLWDNTRLKLGLAKRGTQVYLGAYPDEDEAAKAHDLASLKYWGPGAYTNFPPSLYEEELRTMKTLTKEQYVVILRRRSPGFTRGASKYRGVTRHHQEGRWEARIGRHSGAKYHYLGTFDTQEEAAEAYDRAAVRNRGIKAITNFDISNYIRLSPQKHKKSHSKAEFQET